MSKEMEEKYTKKFEEMSKSVNEILGKQEKTIKQVMEIELWDTIKKPNLRIIGIEEGEELQIKGPENIFNKLQKKTFPT